MLLGMVAPPGPTKGMGGVTLDDTEPELGH